MPPTVIDLATIRRQRDAIARDAPLIVEITPSPDNVNCTRYHITGTTPGAVQSYINSLIAEVESFGNGSGQFIGPFRRGAAWVARCRVVVCPDLGAEQVPP